jgi:hypothetical protein
MRRSAAAGGQRWKVMSAVLVGAAAGALALSGCSGGSAGTKLVDSPQAHQLLDQTKKSAKAAAVSGVRLDGPMVVGATTLTLSLRMSPTSAIGTILTSTGAADVRMLNGALFVNGDGVFWDTLKPGTSAQYAGTWVKVSAKTAPAFAQVLSLIPLGPALDTLAPSSDPRAEVPGRTINGTQTVGLQSLSTPPNIVFLPKSGSSYPLQLQLAKGGVLTFTEWGTKMPAPPAPDGPVLDLTKRTL